MEIEAARYGWGRLTVSAVWIQQRSSLPIIVLIQRTRPNTGVAALAIYQDRSGTLWLARGEGVLIRYR